MKPTAKIILRITAAVILSLLATSCDKELEYGNSFEENFDILWHEIDEKYCFFEYKKDSIKPWDEVRREYLPKVRQCKSSYELFYILADMVNELKDGHVNLYSSFDVSRYDITSSEPIDYDYNLIAYEDRYLGADTKSVSGLKYKTLRGGKIGYLHYSSFSNSFNDTNLDYALLYFANTLGLIIDVRSNGGGYVSQVERFASHFVEEKQLIGYVSHKTGKAHDALSRPTPIYVSPASSVLYLRPIVILTNRGCFSATNQFVQTMKGLPGVKIFGSRTGGGSGVPVTSELPNGWAFRLSANPYYDKEMQCTEFGIDPDSVIHLDTERAYRLRQDNIIESACDYLINISKK